VRELTSRQNANFKKWLSLTESKGIKKEELALISGAKVIEEIFRERPDIAVEAITFKSRSQNPTLETPENVPVYCLPKEMFSELDAAGTNSPILVCKAPRLTPWSGESPEGLELFVALSDPANLGAVIRSAEAFGATQIVLAKESASPYLPKALRAASGSTFRVRLTEGPSIHDLKLANGFGLDMQGQNISELKWPENLFLVLGEEGQGLPENLNLTRIRIPTLGAVESLNATVAASVALYAYSTSANSRKA
jgi:RNA methyltransferase, TrmH family